MRIPAQLLSNVDKVVRLEVLLSISSCKMPIRSLESFLFERKLVNTSSIEILQDATIGIDVEHYLSRIYTFKKEQFLFALGGVPSSLENYIQSDLKVFNEFNIRPVFVLPGLHVNSQERKFATNELSLQEQHLETTWNKLYSKHSSSNGSNYIFLSESFRLHVDPLPIRPMVNDLVKYFIRNGIDYMISPYDASFQLSYLYQNKLIDSIYGSTDVLLTKIDKFILGMEFQSKDFRFVDKQKVLNDLNLTERQFLDISIMVGCSPQPITFSNLPTLPKPNPMSPYQQSSYFKIALDIFFQYSSFSGGAGSDFFGYVSSLNDPLLIDLYYRGHAAIKYMPVLNVEGYTELYSAEMLKLGLIDEINVIHREQESLSHVFEDKSGLTLKIPTELHNVISQRLPPEIYFYHSLGILPLKLLEAITLGTFTVRPPLESGLGEGYKKLITSSDTLDTWDSQFNLITQLLARYYQVKKIEVDYWFRDEKLVLNNRLVPPISARVSNLFLEVPGNFVLKDFLFCLPNTFELTVQAINKSPDGTYSDGNLIASSLVRALFVLKFIDNSTKQVQKPFLLLKKFLETNPSVPDDFLEEITLLVLLLSTGSYNLFSVDRSYPGVPKTFKNAGLEEEISPLEARKVALASRIFSLHKFNIHPINYQGPISRSLLSFRSHIKFVQELLSTSMETCLIDLFVRQGDVKMTYQTRDKWYNLIQQLPFYSDLNNTLLGVICEVYLDNCLKQLKSGQSVEDLIAKGKSHLLDQVLQVGNLSFNINLNSINSVSPDQFACDFLAGVKLWDYFVLLAEIATQMNCLITRDDFNLILETSDVIHKFSTI